MSKIPPRRVSADSLVIKSGGESYRPHEGEYVEVAGGPSWSFMRDAAELTRLENTPFNQMTAEESRGLVAIIDRIVTFLASRIVGWDWTDNQGQPLPAPTAEVLGELEQVEVQWLVQVLIGGVAPAEAEAAEKNA